MIDYYNFNFTIILSSLLFGSSTLLLWFIHSSIQSFVHMNVNYVAPLGCADSVERCSAEQKEGELVQGRRTRRCCWSGSGKWEDELYARFQSSSSSNIPHVITIEPSCKYFSVAAFVFLLLLLRVVGEAGRGLESCFSSLQLWTRIGHFVALQVSTAAMYGCTILVSYVVCPHSSSCSVDIICLSICLRHHNRTFGHNSIIIIIHAHFSQ